MSGGVVLIIVIVLFVFVIIGFNNEVKSKSKAREQKRINESNAAKIQQLKQEIKPIEVPQRREKTKEEIYRELQNSVEITEAHYRSFFRFMNEDEFIEMKGVISINSNLVRIEKTFLSELERRKSIEDKDREKSKQMFELTNRGIELEEQGNYEEAIKAFEEVAAFRDRFSNYSISFDRLLVIYRKLKDYENEKRVCLAAIERFGNKKYKDRLLTIEDKITKASKP